MPSWKGDPEAIRVITGTATRTGRTHADTGINEDTAIVGTGVWGIADGMGGPGGGAIASAVAAEAVLGAIRNGLDGANAAQVAHEAVLERASTDHPGMGTTLCIGVSGWHENLAAIQLTNVGDSRAYAWDPSDGARQVTRDQKWLQRLIDDGVLSEEEARRHPQRNAIVSAVGIEDLCQPVTAVIPVAAGARFLFCSDGISDELDPDRLAELLASSSPAQAVAEALVTATDEPRDDATAVIVDVLAVRRPRR